MSVFILWFSHFDVIVKASSFPVYHRQCKQNKFLIQNGLYPMQEADLRIFLLERGVSCSFYRKYHLERRYKLAYEMNLEVDHN